MHRDSSSRADDGPTGSNPARWDRIRIADQLDGLLSAPSRLAPIGRFPNPVSRPEESDPRSAPPTDGRADQGRFSAVAVFAAVDAPPAGLPIFESRHPPG